MDPRTKLVGLEFLVREFHKFIGYDTDISELITDIKICEDLYDNKHLTFEAQLVSLRKLVLKINSFYYHLHLKKTKTSHFFYLMNFTTSLIVVLPLQTTKQVMNLLIFWASKNHRKIYSILFNNAHDILIFPVPIITSESSLMQVVECLQSGEVLWWSTH